LENPVPPVVPPTVDQTISIEKSSVLIYKEIIESKLKKAKEALEDASIVHGIVSLSDIKMRLESIRKMV